MIKQEIEYLYLYAEIYKASRFSGDTLFLLLIFQTTNFL